MSSGTPNVRLLLLAGPSVAVKVACTDEVTALGTTDERDCVNGDGSSAIKTIDAGVMVGAGVGLRRVSLTARYDIDWPTKRAALPPASPASTAPCWS